MDKKKALGRGLDVFFGNNEEEITEETKSTENNNGVLEIDIHLIDNNTQQPRKEFDEETLNELAESIKEHGIVQPIIVTKHGERYMIVAGERRFRAARIAGLTKVPVLVREMTDEEVYEIALIENIQRQDLNPIEEALAIRTIMQKEKLTQEEVASKLGKSRAAIANALRLLNLPDSIHKMLINGEIQIGHAKVLLSAKEEHRESLAQQAAEEGWSVRMLEEKINGKKVRPEGNKRKQNADERRAAEIVEAENNMRARLGTKVKVSGDTNRGKIVIEYYSQETLEGIYALICQED